MTTKKKQILALTQEQMKKYILPLLPENKRGFASKVDPLFILTCIQHKLKTGCQWGHLFIEHELISYPCSSELVYYFFNRWSKLGVFKQAFHAILQAKAAEVAPLELNLDGTHTAAKKGVRAWRIKAVKKRGPAIIYT